MTRVDLSILRGLESGGWLRAKPHGDYLIWDYTQRTQAQKRWTKETLMCRGLVTTHDGLIVSRPFPKFFNLGEQPLPAGLGQPLVYEKVDGSLIVVSLHEGRRIVSSRSSMDNPHTRAAETLLGDWQPLPGYTYCLELTHPDMRIVVDYGPLPQLRLLARIYTDMGTEMPPWYATEWQGETARYLPGARLENLRAYEGSNAEGFVLHWPEHGLRVKVKFAEYLRLHKLLTGVSTRSIWEMLRDGKPTEALYENVPDEFHAWVSGEVDALSAEFATVHITANGLYRRVSQLSSRAEQARAIADSPYRSIIFAWLDNKPVTAQTRIWNLVEPEKSRPFWGVAPELAEAA